MQIADICMERDDYMMVAYFPFGVTTVQFIKEENVSPQSDRYSCEAGMNVPHWSYIYYSDKSMRSTPYTMR